VHDKRVSILSEWALFHQQHHPSNWLQFSPPPNMPSTSKEDMIVLALKALERDATLKVNTAAKIYGVDRMTLTRRRDGKPARYDTPANSRKLTDLEEKTIVQYIIKLYTRTFHPRLCYVENMANRLLRERNAPPVGIQWAHNFVKRQPELRTRFTRKYNYQRAKCKDPKVIRE